MVFLGYVGGEIVLVILDSVNLFFIANADVNEEKNAKNAEFSKHLEFCCSGLKKMTRMNYRKSVVWWNFCVVISTSKCYGKNRVFMSVEIGSCRDESYVKTAKT